MAFIDEEFDTLSPTDLLLKELLRQQRITNYLLMRDMNGVHAHCGTTEALAAEYDEYDKDFRTL